MITRRRLVSLVALSLPLSSAVMRADQWTVPTPAELAMTSIPEVPNAPAVYLFKEQTTDDAMHSHSYYVRLKVLTERGKEYANVELPFVSGSAGFNVEDIAGRTIHPDGSIVPFTGKPYEKLIAKAGNYKEKAKVFTLPAVEIGSILEYRYKIRFDDMYFSSPDWFIQSDLFVKKGHYMWRPTSKDLVNEKGDRVSGHVAWAPLLPPDTKIKDTQMPNGHLQLELDIHDIPPTPSEDYMPPVDSLSYRVLFYYTAYASSGEFWKSEGKTWSKARDHFMSSNQALKDFALSTVSASDSPTEKAGKLYAAVMKFENTDYTRERSTREEKAEGLKDITTVNDVVARKRGNSNEIAETYVALARAVGIKAYVAAVSNRDRHFFLPMYLNVHQVDDDLAILTLDGKEVFYDPGQRFCEPGHLAWKHTMSGGIRQADNGAALFTSPIESYKSSTVDRIADLVLDDHGIASGKVTIRFAGDPALTWRQEALRGDDTSLKADLRTQLEGMLPGGTEVTVTNIDNVSDYLKPLKVEYEIKGPVATSTGKRLLIPADIFEFNTKPKFASAKREIAIDMHFSSISKDAVRYKFPASMTIESVPTPTKELVQTMGVFETFTNRTPNTVTTYRNVTIASAMYGAKEYAELKSFYGKLETKDQETLILTHSASAANPPAAQSGGKSGGN